uniref:Alpha-ketoglutarate-dependent dioxygenase AlkB-like domain-containing protein n=1 Tax=Chromera velia CCMP2878 TaxID=1169474 RepID=A0A0G4FM00_9ALVE|eukprot:Cvel_17703.t1-p1 / transcript=Cvel_17703.t1 / gene=Cvel_17703 / organism=Chromera_velia_CCMP2878 / gene_product=hypothetical protein / transcript_product=hypothetical protein / location=Cvel_scaffold1429:9661-13926(+) / protein_length=584 / sequence_SO=supercontig / SO=protein_coding / is_pseudo=false
MTEIPQDVIDLTNDSGEEKEEGETRRRPEESAPLSEPNSSSLSSLSDTLTSSLNRSKKRSIEHVEGKFQEANLFLAERSSGHKPALPVSLPQPTKETANAFDILLKKQRRKVPVPLSNAPSLSLPSSTAVSIVPRGNDAEGKAGASSNGFGWTAGKAGSASRKAKNAEEEKGNRLTVPSQASELSFRSTACKPGAVGEGTCLSANTADQSSSSTSSSSSFSSSSSSMYISARTEASASLPPFPQPFVRSFSSLQGLFLIENLVSQEEEAQLLSFLFNNPSIQSPAVEHPQPESDSSRILAVPQRSGRSTDGPLPLSLPPPPSAAAVAASGWRQSGFNGPYLVKTWGVQTDFQKRCVSAPDRSRGGRLFPSESLDFVWKRAKELIGKKRIPALEGWRPNEANANLYLSDAGHFLEPHFDDRFLSGPVLMTLSLQGHCAMTYKKGKQEQKEKSKSGAGTMAGKGKREAVQPKQLQTRLNLLSTIHQPSSSSCPPRQKGAERNSISEDRRDEGPSSKCTSAAATTSTVSSSGTSLTVQLPPRSILVVSGAARYDHTHEIQRGHIQDSHRVSITFRHAKTACDGRQWK